MLPLVCCSAWAVACAVLTATNGVCGGSSTCRLACPIADSAPVFTWERAALSALLSSPAAIDWTRKKPSTAMTSADSTSVVETTRSCSERCQRLRSCATSWRCQPRPANRLRRTRRAACAMTDLPNGDRKKLVMQSLLPVGACRCHVDDRTQPGPAL